MTDEKPTATARYSWSDLPIAVAAIAAFGFAVGAAEYFAEASGTDARLMSVLTTNDYLAAAVMPSGVAILSTLFYVGAPRLIGVELFMTDIITMKRRRILVAAMSVVVLISGIVLVSIRLNPLIGPVICVGGAAGLSIALSFPILRKDYLQGFALLLIIVTASFVVIDYIEATTRPICEKKFVQITGRKDETADFVFVLDRGVALANRARNRFVFYPWSSVIGVRREGRPCSTIWSA